MSLRAIVANYNEPPAAAQAHIHVATHINVYQTASSSSIGLHQVAYETVASSLQVQFA